MKVERASQFASGIEFQVRGAAVLNDRLVNDVHVNMMAEMCIACILYRRG